MNLAIAASLRGTCDRKKVGCVLVIDKRVVATGYNGALPGAEHCDDVGHDLVETLDHLGVPKPNCVRTVHAEANCVAIAARYGIATNGATAYTNTYTCWPCFRLLVSAGVTRVVFDDGYRVDPRVQETASRLGVLVERIADESAAVPHDDAKCGAV
jgi:dCMP deaminase